MQSKWKSGVYFFLAVTLIAVLCLGCGGKGEKGKVTIVIGEVTDLTGPGAPALVPVHYAIQDIVRYYNEESLISGVKLKLATYDTGSNLARDIPGYDWTKEQGAKLVIAVLGSTAEAVKPFAERDKVAVATSVSTVPIVEPPGWVFSFGTPYDEQYMTLLKWISENDWNYTAQQRPPKIGFVSWRIAAGVAAEKGISGYCQAHPEQFEYVGAALPPAGTTDYSSQANQLKSCDYIAIEANAAGYFIRDYQGRGLHQAKFISDSSAGAFTGLSVDLIGWEALDGFLSVEPTRQWGESYPMVELAQELLRNNHPGEAATVIDAGTGYVGSFASDYPIFDVLRKAIVNVGPGNFDGQAFYNAAVGFEVQYEGYPKWSFSESDRSLVHDVAVYKWTAEVKGKVRVSDWLPLVKE